MNSDRKVVLLGIDTPIGLTMIRELAFHGVTVYGIGRSHRALGAYSRFIHRAYVRPSDEDGTIALMARLAVQERIPFLMTVSEPDIFMIHRRSSDLGGLRPLVPPPKPFSIVTDKAATLRVARELGIDVPTNWQLSFDDDLEKANVQYPVVLKWPNPNTVARELARLGIEFRKIEYCHGPTELRAAMSRYEPVGTLPLIQSFVPGHGLGHMIFLNGGNALLTFQHRRIAEWPPEGGFSVVSESLPSDHHPELMEKSIELLRRIDWVGPAMVEYRYDARTERATLMEINGRFWGSLPLAYRSGAHFVWLTYSALGLKRIPDRQTPTTGVRCRYVVPELKRLLRIVFRSSAIHDRSAQFSRVREVMAFLFRFAGSRYSYYVFALRDPVPCLADFCFGLLRFFRGGPHAKRQLGTNVH